VTDERLEAMQGRLVRRLNLEEPDDDVLVLLEDELEDAEAELLLYLNREPLPEALYPKVLELADLYARRDLADNPDLASASYSEGDTSQSETYLTGKDYRDQEDDLLSSVAHWRRRVAT
jgi:hypothetical protein